MGGAVFVQAMVWLSIAKPYVHAKLDNLHSFGFFLFM
jgi:hypothetical protein